ncbi:MAG: translation initiation factor IF-2 [Myxococcaceae bacterium]|nr:translation initiation factor IF-2 [Myxococcaceae bacterium]
MSKKRVHEIAKDLKDSGVELDNKAVVDELKALGYDVKSHSSSLEDDEAREAVKRILDKKKPKAAPAPVAAKGFVVRRKVVDSAPAPMGAASVPPPPSAPPPAAAPVEVEVPAAPAAPEPEVAAPVETPEPPKKSAPRPPRASPAAVPAGAAPVASEPVAAPMPPPPAPVAAPSAPAVAAAPAPAAVAAPRASAPRAVGAVGAVGAVATGVQRVGVTARPSAPRPGVAPVRPNAPPTQLPGEIRRPTATQAVVIQRPLIPVRRVTPASSAHKSFPAAPGRKAIGEVREFKVVPDHLGRGKVLEDVSKAKERERAGRGRKPAEKEGTQVSQQDIRDLMSGRVAIPIRGKKKKPTKKGQKTQITEMAEEKKVIKVQDGITVSELSQRMGVKTGDIIKKLMSGGKMATANQSIDPDTAAILATDYGWKVEKVGFEVEDYLPEVTDKAEDLKARPPVVTVMGHVDHGKTSLLDAIREANVAAGEAGGITQHIGAYSVTTSRGDITFLDTPGHEAFSAMRSRGANLTDIVVLVVAADDGVMPQTKEAIKHAKEADVPMVVAINKIDKEGANPERVKKELADNNVLAEDWGGDVIMVPVSAKQKTGLELLLENISLQAEVLELQTNPNKAAVGTIIEARLEKGRGPVATVLVQEGTLKKGDAIVTGTNYGRVRMMINARGEQLDELLPGYSAEVVGLNGVPPAGDTINAVEDEKAAREIAQHRELKERQAESGKTARGTLDSLLNKMQASEQKELKIVLKADVSGSLEAVATALEKLSTRKVKTTIVHKGVGMMTETDVNTAAALKAVVVGFNSRPESGAEAAAKVLEVELVTYSIIYELLDGIKLKMEDLLEPIRTEKKLGRAEVRALYNVPKLGVVAGSSVLDGVIKRTSHLRLWRENKQIHSGKVASLKRFKDDVKEVGQGFECGIGIEGYSDLKPGDIIEAFEIEETRPSLN